MAGRVLLVCALCVLCCCGGGVGAWGGGYCTESDWRDLRAVAKDMTEAEIEGQYCSGKPEFVQGLRASLQSVNGEDEGEEQKTSAGDGKETSGKEGTGVDEAGLSTDKSKNGNATDEEPPAKGSGGASHTSSPDDQKTQDGGVGQTDSPQKPTTNNGEGADGKESPSGDTDSTRDQSGGGTVNPEESERTKGEEIPPRQGSSPSPSPKGEEPSSPSQPEEGRGPSTDVSQGETNAGKEGQSADDNGSATQNPSHVPEKGPQEKQAAEGDPEQSHQGHPLPPQPHTEGTQNTLSDDADLQGGEKKPAAGHTDSAAKDCCGYD
ncbi:hypothetical protein TraAM80_10206 [Trypanosoma rangeli]|uniref:Mucin-associated surface protein (MASP) n=1 Tax=Trypanosoma rangeli TaxID=5698 RepID=A0A422MRB7_TRYRA|nr:uncharacterized protein TraAM80_10206 [Trypanosoma rangeli]RNE95772.1 hypothetical protein TraAM80_10206 [Trypanosoma rangeli]|eukprot:RNE95772.1 hypothetical protein TraAM80_10206 [Trypanosoma rangeli]